MHVNDGNVQNVTREKTKTKIKINCNSLFGQENKIRETLRLHLSYCVMQIGKSKNCIFLAVNETNFFKRFQ